jgi:hypothetical protein
MTRVGTDRKFSGYLLEDDYNDAGLFGFSSYVERDV